MTTFREMAEIRQGAVRELKRTLIREAAKELFARHGIAHASVREIAKAAGYTTGTIYTYYATKEELYAEILQESLQALIGDLAAAAEQSQPGRRSIAVLQRLLHFYVRRPHDYDLSFYLYSGARPVGLSPVLDYQLNSSMEDVMSTIGRSLIDDGLATDRTACHQAVMVSTYVFGVLLMSKTGRLRTLDQNSDDLLNTFLEAFVSHEDGDIG